MSDLITVARTWIGTPYHHHQSTKGVGCDCIGFIKGVANEIGYSIELENYNRLPTGDLMIETLDKFVTRVNRTTPKEGDILCFKTSFKGLPTHVGFCSNYNGEIGLIEACSRVEKVIECNLGFRIRLLVGCWVLKNG